MTRTPKTLITAQEGPVLPMDKVLTDYWGPSKFKTLHQHTGADGFVDYASRYFFGVLRIQKGGSTSVSKFKAHIKRFAAPEFKTKPISVFQTDSEGMYTGPNSDFNRDLVADETFLQVAAPHSHWQHAIIEIIWKSLFVMVRHALLYAGVLTEYWGAAFLYAIWIYNRLPHSALDGKSPAEILTKVVPDFSKARILFCPVHVLLQEDDRLSKTHSRVRSGIHFGISENTSDAYKIWLPDEKRLVISRDVRFDEG
jgi:hypothetical protein